MLSPWWYRKRALVFAAIYVAGFWPAALYDATARHSYIPAVDALGLLWGERGVPVAIAVALLLTFACWLVRVWGSGYLLSSTVWSADSRSDAFVTAGPFAYTRNPLYLGNVLLALGLGSLAPAPGWLFINIANMAFVVMLIRWEERGMRARYGERFDAYCARVPQLFPRLTPGETSNARPSLREGLRAEIFTAALLAGMIAVVVKAFYGWPLFFLFYVAGMAAQTMLARKAANV